MQISDLIKRVRWCLDEETVNFAQMTQSGTVGNDDDGYMDNIIKDKIPDAMRWCALYAPDGLLHSDKESGNPPTPLDSAFLKTETISSTSGRTGCTTFKLPADFGRLVRIRLDDWRKAVRFTIEEDSDEYLMVDADTAKATNDRPVAALIRTQPNMLLECWPGGEGSSGETVSIDITYVCVPDIDMGSNPAPTSVDIPGKMESAVIYYIAFLVATAYRDSIANSLLQIARMHLGLS